MIKKITKENAHKKLTHLKYILKQYHKDKISLSNLKIKFKNLAKKLEELKTEQEDLNIKYDNVIFNISNLKNNYVNKTTRIHNIVNKPNLELNDQIDEQKKDFEEKNVQLDFIKVN